MNGAKNTKNLPKNTGSECPSSGVQHAGAVQRVGAMYPSMTKDSGWPKFPVNGPDEEIYRAASGKDRPAEILIVEDNPGDSALLCTALKEWNRKIRINIVEDGDKALKYVRREGIYAAKRLPDLVL